MSREVIVVGFDPRETAAFMVTVASARAHLSRNIPITGLELTELQELGFYMRPTEVREGKLFDVISDHPMATEFALTRFLVPRIVGQGWALFLDCDMLVTADLAPLFDQADDKYAVMCVKREHNPSSTTKMDGQVQSSYWRKNWSSVCLFNCSHPANSKLDTDINVKRGLDLHQFCWLSDDLIGELPREYNFLVGTDVVDLNLPPKIIHFTEGTPNIPGYERCDYSELWHEELRKSARVIL